LLTVLAYSNAVSIAREQGSEGDVIVHIRHPAAAALFSVWIALTLRLPLGRCLTRWWRLARAALRSITRAVHGDFVNPDVGTELSCDVPVFPLAQCQGAEYSHRQALGQVFDQPLATLSP